MASSPTKDEGTADSREDHISTHVSAARNQEVTSQGAQLSGTEVLGGAVAGILIRRG